MMLRILVVDDDFISRSQLKSLLSSYGDCDSAPDGEVALLMVKDAIETRTPYDFITLDVEMPKMKGYEVLSAIRKLESELHIPTDKQIKIVMVTVKNKLADVSAAYKQECSGYLIKPATAQTLKETLLNLGLVK